MIFCLIDSSSRVVPTRDIPLFHPAKRYSFYKIAPHEMSGLNETLTATLYFN